MPITVKVVSEAAYAEWLARRQGRRRAAVRRSATPVQVACERLSLSGCGDGAGLQAGPSV